LSGRSDPSNSPPIESNVLVLPNLGGMLVANLILAMSLHQSFRHKAKAILPIVAAAFTCASVSAITYRDLDLFTNVHLDSDASTLAPSDFHGQFDLRPDGFDPVTMDATSGFVGFIFGSEDDRQEFKVALENLTSGTQYVDYFKIYSAGLSADLLVEISDLGTLDYTITAVSGAFSLFTSYLEVETAGSATSVPDGGATAVLLGLGVLGIATVRNIRRS
jgi:VPDSG-CTERM motif